MRRLAPRPSLLSKRRILPLVWLAFSGGGVARLFLTHPPTEERVARLLAMVPAASPQRSALPRQYSPWGGGGRNPWG
jgi:hypothetical protein